MPTLSQSGPPGIRARHGPEDSVVATDARLDASTHTPPSRSIDDLLAETRMTSTDVQTIDEAKLEAFAGQAVVDMGAAICGLLLHIGDRLGLYRRWPVLGRSPRPSRRSGQAPPSDTPVSGSAIRPQTTCRL
jgi:hypothetical protein